MCGGDCYLQAVLWNVRSLEPSHILEDHGGIVMSTDLNDSATTAFTGSGDGVSPFSL